jgi:hypothetical protein
VSKAARKLAGVVVAEIQARYGIQKGAGLTDLVLPLAEAAVGGKSVRRKLAELERAVRVLEAADARPAMPQAPQGAVAMDPAEWVTRLHQSQPHAVNGHDLGRVSNGQQAAPQWHPER